MVERRLSWPPIMVFYSTESGTGTAIICAAAERVFSLLVNMFGDQQHDALEDYVDDR